jgi:hypothetical protein
MSQVSIFKVSDAAPRNFGDLETCETLTSKDSLLVRLQNEPELLLGSRRGRYHAVNNATQLIPQEQNL